MKKIMLLSLLLSGSLMLKAGDSQMLKACDSQMLKAGGSQSVPENLPMLGGWSPYTGHHKVLNDAFKDYSLEWQATNPINYRLKKGSMIIPLGYSKAISVKGVDLYAGSNLENRVAELEKRIGSLEGFKMMIIEIFEIFLKKFQEKRAVIENMASTLKDHMSTMLDEASTLKDHMSTMLDEVKDKLKKAPLNLEAGPVVSKPTSASSATSTVQS